MIKKLKSLLKVKLVEKSERLYRERTTSSWVFYFQSASEDAFTIEREEWYGICTVKIIDSLVIWSGKQRPSYTTNSLAPLLIEIHFSPIHLKHPQLK